MCWGVFYSLIHVDIYCTRVSNEPEQLTPTCDILRLFRSVILLKLDDTNEQSQSGNERIQCVVGGNTEDHSLYFTVT